MLRKVNVGSTAVGFIDGMSEYELGPYCEDVEMGKAEVDSRLAVGAVNDKGVKAYRIEVKRERQRQESREKAEREVEQMKKLEEEERRVPEAATKKMADEAKRAETEAEERKKAEERRRAQAAEQQKKKWPPLGVFYEYY
jgi:hypothetical protein